MHSPTLPSSFSNHIYHHSTNLSARKHNIAQHFANAHDYCSHASVQQKICQQLIEQIQSPIQDSVLEIGAGQGQLTQLLANTIQAKNWYINELSEAPKNKLQQSIPSATLYIGDAETMDLGNQHSLIISANAIQWFDQPLQFIQQSANRLQAGGQLLFNTFTEDNFYQIKQLTGQGLTYPSQQMWQEELLSNGFEVIDISRKKYHLNFETPYEVLKHIKQTGVSTINASDSDGKSNNYNTKTHHNSRSIDSTNVIHSEQNKHSTQMPFRWTKATLATFDKNYRQHFSNEQGEVVLTYEALIINAKKQDKAGD